MRKMNKRSTLIRIRKIVSDTWGWDCFSCGTPLVPDQYRHNDKYVNIAEDGSISPKPPYDFPVLVKDVDGQHRLVCGNCEAKYDKDE